MHYHGHRERLRKRLMDDSKKLQDYEIIELLLGYVLVRRDTKPLAKKLLEQFGGIRQTLQAPAQQLSAVQGIGPGIVAFLTLLTELNARLAEEPLKQDLQLCSPDTVAQMARERLGHLAHEEVWIAFVDNQNHLIQWEKASTGSINTSVIYPREILERALLLKASGFILVHNHPGGSCQPSGADIELTQRIQRAAQSLFIRFIDHVIVTRTAYYSLTNDGLL